MRTQKVFPPNEPLTEGDSSPIRQPWWRFFHGLRGDVQDAEGIALQALLPHGPDLQKAINEVSEFTFAQFRPGPITLQQTVGSWTPADNSGASLTFTSVSAAFTQIGNMVFAYFTLTYPTTADASPASIKGLPYTVPNQNYAQIPAVVTSGATIANEVIALPRKGTLVASFMTGNPTVSVLNSTLSTFQVSANLIYPVS